MKDDAISRQAVLDLYNKYRPSLATHVSEFGDALKALPPSVNTEKTGRWIDQGYKEEWWAEYYNCSECGYGMVGVDNYCPNCGAKMEVEE